MTGKTHRAGGVLTSLIGFSILYNKGLLVQDIYPILQLGIIYPYSIWGSIASDLDHNKQSAPSKDIISTSINSILHSTQPLRKRLEETMTKKELKKSWLYKFSLLLSAKHRSWQTHSDLTLGLLVYLLFNILSSNTLGGGNINILILIMTGVLLGLISHLILDMLTTEGIWFISGIFINKIFRVKILPETLSLHLSSKNWEEPIYKLIKFSTYIALIYVITLLFNIDCLEIIRNLITNFPYEINWR